MRTASARMVAVSGHLMPGPEFGKLWCTDCLLCLLGNNDPDRINFVISKYCQATGRFGLLADSVKLLDFLVLSLI